MIGTASEIPNFFVALDFNRVGIEAASDRDITEPLRNWLDGLDPDEVEEDGFAAAPELPTSQGLGSRSESYRRQAGGPRKTGASPARMGPSLSGYVNDVDMIGRTLNRKPRKYGKPKESPVLARDS